MPTKCAHNSYGNQIHAHLDLSFNVALGCESESDIGKYDKRHRHRHQHRLWHGLLWRKRHNTRNKLKAGDDGDDDYDDALMFVFCNVGVALATNLENTLKDRCCKSRREFGVAAAS